MAINYAEQYGTALAQAFPNVLHFGALYSTPNNSRITPACAGKTCFFKTLSNAICGSPPRVRVKF